MPVTLLVPVTELSQVGDARRKAASMGSANGLNETECGSAALVVTEVGNNLVKHGHGGEIILRTVDSENGRGLEIIAVDGGPGMDNVETCLRDGYSTAGTPGTGLGAARRLSSEFDIWSAPGAGTALVSRIYSRSSRPTRSQTRVDVEVGAVTRPFPGETVCGDAWAMRRVSGLQRMLVVDGLGHGPVAAQASGEAVHIFESTDEPDLVSLVRRMHDGLRHTRGAAMAVVDLDPEAQQIRFVGIGNIAAAVITETSSKSMMSHNGTVGAIVRQVAEFTYPWPYRSLLVVNSDGLTTRWTLSGYPDIKSHDPSLTAALLYRDFQRSKDDATVVVIRAGSG